MSSTSPTYVTITPVRGKSYFNVERFPRNPSLELKEPPEIDMLSGASANLQKEITDALLGRGEYRGTFATTLLNFLFQGEMDELVQNLPPYIKFTFIEDTLWLQPEMVPVGSDWLDKVAPSYRTCNCKVSNDRTSDKRSPSVALVYMEGDSNFNFEDWAQTADQQLKQHGLISALFPGRQLAGGPERRIEQLHHIFHDHRVVCFFGHLMPDKKENYGWALTPESTLTMEELKVFLGPSKVRVGKSEHNLVPEVIFSGCCAGGGQDPSKHGWPGLVYPRVFLDGGVRFYVGAWMDAIGPLNGEEFLKQHVVGLAVDFLGRWAEEPDHAIYHLYDAKKKLGFHLIDSLFHIYAPYHHEPPPRGERKAEKTEAHRKAEPHGAFISSVSERARLGNYELLRQVWSDSFSKTFWATSVRGNHLVQVLSDEWQGNAELARRLNLAIQKLQSCQFGEGHLVPTRSEVCERQVGESKQMQLVVVSDRPPNETPDSWVSLEEQSFNPLDKNHFLMVMDLAKELAGRIIEMHEKKVRHGNLSPQCLVFRRNSNGSSLLVLKDAWLWACRPNQRMDDRYTPPEERRAPPSPDELKGDCWAFGAVLYEIATGSALPSSMSESPATYSIRQAARPVEHRVPEALEQIVKECLMPSVNLRPSAEQIGYRVVLGHAQGRSYRNEFEATLFRGIHGGQRLFAVPAVDRQDFEPTLRVLEDYGHPVFVFEPQVGIVRYGTSQVLGELEWMSAQAIDDRRMALARQYRQPPPPPVNGDEVIAINSSVLLKTAFEGLRTQNDSLSVPVIAIFGGFPWNGSPLGSQIAIQRRLRACEAEYGAPVVIVADARVAVGEQVDFEELFHWLNFPPLAPADLFDRVISSHVTEGLSLPPLSIEQANEIAERLHPISGRQLSYVLRLAALEYGVIDERVSSIRDFTFEQAFRQLGTVTYSPVALLPPSDHVGLPHETRTRALQWVELVKAASEAAIPAPQRLVVEGPAGYGKTTTALMLGALTLRPVVRVEISRCLGRNLGDSERALKRTLNYVQWLPAVLVLFDDIDNFLDFSAAGTATLQRMSGAILQWMDTLPAHVVVVLTVKQSESLPPQWQRRIQQHLPLDRPVGLNDGAASDGYRAQVLGAVFRKHGLKLADNPDFLLHLGRRTNPSLLGSRTLHNPMALVAGAKKLIELKVTLDTSAAINEWVETVLLFHGERGDPETIEFWEQKLG